MNHRELVSISAADFWFDPAIIRPVLVLLEQKAAQIAETYQQLAALCPAATQAQAAPTPESAATKVPRPLNHRKVTPKAKAPARPTPAEDRRERVVATPPLGVLGLPVPRAPRNKRDDRILATLAETKGLTCTEIGQKLKVPVPTIYGALQRLVRDGRLTCGGDKKYRGVVDPAAVERVN